MKTKTNLFIAAFLFTASVSAQELQQTERRPLATKAPRADRERVYDETKQYIVFQLWTESDPLSADEKNSLQYLKQQLAGKNVKVIDYQYKTAADLDKFFRENGVSDVTVSTDDGIRLKSENSNYNTTAQKAVFLFEEKSPGVKRPMMISSGTGSLNNVKRFFKLRSFS